MPFITEIKTAFGRAGIWELSDGPTNHLSGFTLSETEKFEFEKINNGKRKAEYLATRQLLQKMLGKKTEISYQPDGRPVLPDTTLNISISHSANLVVIFLAEIPCGVDTEVADRNIDNIAKRFLHTSEMKQIEDSGNRKFQQMLYWCAKEAVFKCSRQHGIQFDEQIRIDALNDKTANTFEGRLFSGNTTEYFNLEMMEFKNNIIVFCVEMGNNEK